MAHIHRILDDEKFPVGTRPSGDEGDVGIGARLRQRPERHRPVWLHRDQPIPVNGPIGQLAYLSRLETQSGQRILFHRLGAIGTVDVFEAVSFNGSRWFILFVDLYHPRRSRLTPDGFRFTKDVVAQFSGFHKFCENFPYDFVEKKASERESGLSMAHRHQQGVRPIQNRVQQAAGPQGQARHREKPLCRASNPIGDGNEEDPSGGACRIDDPPGRASLAENYEVNLTRRAATFTRSTARTSSSRRATATSTPTLRRRFSKRPATAEGDFLRQQGQMRREGGLWRVEAEAGEIRGDGQP